MAQQIAGAGFSMVVHDVREEAAGPLLAMGATWADSPAAVARECDVLCTCLPGPPEMESVVLGDGGILEGIQAGTVYVDHTTNSPALVRKIQGILKGQGVEMLDAPVSGGKEGAETRDLTVLVGGDSSTFEKARPVLDAMAKTVMHVGDIGAGCVCKITHNSASFSVELAMVECLTLGVKAGVDPAVMVEVFQKCAVGRNFGIQVRLPATLFSGDFDPRFALKLARKDIGLATELARTHDVPMPVVELCEREVSEAVSRGWADRDSSIFLTLQEERAGAQVRVK
jgi:3-hydroxyisobutyrate dehydrogenase